MNNAYLNSAGAHNLFDKMRKNSSSAGGYRAQKFGAAGSLLGAQNKQSVKKLKGTYYAS